MDFALVLVIITIVGYFVLMYFYPEWVGITGKTAKKTLKSHEAGSKADDSDPLSKTLDD